jgi:HlyD family secretion protein
LCPYSPLPTPHSLTIKAMKRLSISLVLISLCTACNLPNKPLQKDTKAENVVTPAALTSVIALGRIEPEGEVIKLSVANAQDSRINQILVKEGDFVKANQVIAVLQGLDRKQAELRDGQAQVRLKQAELIKVQQGDSKKAALTAQQAVISRLEAALSPETKQKKSAIASAESVQRAAFTNFQRRQILQTQGAISRSDLDIARRDWETAKAAVEEKKAQLEQSISSLNEQIKQERSNLAQLQEVRPVDVEIAKAQLEQAKILVEQKTAELEDAKVRAPIAGQILKINTRVGEQVNVAQGIVELARTNQMYAIAEVAEGDIVKVVRGQRASITSEYGGFPNQVLGTVENVGLQIVNKTLQDAANNGPSKDDNARTVAVKIRIDPKDSPKVASLTNMQVKVQLDITNNNSIKQAKSNSVNNDNSAQAFRNN